jgi:hypothetical protein
LVERPLELGQRAGLVHACIHQDDSRADLKGPGIAVGHAWPRERKPEPPQPAEDALSTTSFAPGTVAPRGHSGALIVWRSAATLHRATIFEKC